MTCQPEGGQALVLAGPGAGKTRTLVARIDWLLDRGARTPEQVLALTFTHQAAGELRERLGRHDRAAVTAETFHAFCADLLQRHGATAGVPLLLRIADRPRQEAILGRTAEEVGCCLGSRGPLSFREATDHVARRKQARLEPGSWRAD